MDVNNVTFNDFLEKGITNPKIKDKLDDAYAPASLATVVNSNTSDIAQNAVAISSNANAITVNYANQRLAEMAYRLGNFSLSAASADASSWVIQALTADGKQIIATKASTKELGYSTDDGATFTSAETFAKEVKDVHMLSSGRLIVAVTDSGGPCDIYRSGTDWQSNPAGTTFTKVYTGLSNEPSIWPAYSYSGITDKNGTTIWAALYGAKTNVSVGSSPGAVRVLRSTDSGATWSTCFNLATWLVSIGKNPDTWGYHLHGVVYDPFWDRVWVSFGDTSGANGLNGLLYSDDDGTTWNVAYTNESLTALGYTGDHQAVGMWPMQNSLVLQCDGNPAYVYTIPRYGYRGIGTGNQASADPIIKDAHLITSDSGSPAVGLQPFQQTYPGAPLLLPITQQLTRSANQSLSRLVATGDGSKFYTLFTDVSGSLVGFEGITTAVGPTASGKIVGTRRGAGSVIQRWVATV